MTQPSPSKKLRERLPLSLKLRLKRLLFEISLKLRGRSLPDTRNQVVRSNNADGPPVIVFDDRFPVADRDAGSARMLSVLKTLAKCGRTVFVYNVKPPTPAHEEALWQVGVETSPMMNYRKLLKHEGFKIAILSRPEIAGPLLRSIRSTAPDIRIIYDMVDAHFIRLEREHKVSGAAGIEAEARRSKQIEIDLARNSDRVWCTSPDDQQAIEAERISVPIDIIPTIHSLRSLGRSFSDREHILFVGHFAHRPNADGVQFFLREIFPLIKESIPEMVFFVAGTDPPPEVQAYASDSVRVLGYVPDIDPYFQNSRVFVAPVRFGAGVKGKIGDALSYGLPLVTTSMGAEGMGLVHREHVMIADGPAAFAAAVIDVYRDPVRWQHLSDKGREIITERFSPEAVGKTIVKSIATTAGDHPR